MPELRFRTPLYYKFVRHPIYLGFIIAFWAAAVMTTGHLSVRCSHYGLHLRRNLPLEERDLVDLSGEDYRRYKDRVSMVLPWRKSS